MTRRYLIIPRLIQAALVVFAAHGAIASTASEREIIDRIKPVGRVCTSSGLGCEDEIASEPAPQEAAEVAVVAPPSSSSARSGEEVYNSTCITCHAASVAGAPRPGDAMAWEGRLGQGTDVLVAHAINGLKAMPPRGTCMGCTDEEIKAAVEFMIEGL